MTITELQAILKPMKRKDRPITFKVFFKEFDCALEFEVKKIHNYKDVLIIQGER